MKHFKIQLLFNNPKKCGSCDQYPKKFKTQQKTPLIAVCKYAKSTPWVEKQRNNKGEQFYKSSNGSSKIAVYLSRVWLGILFKKRVDHRSSRLSPSQILYRVRILIFKLPQESNTSLDKKISWFCLHIFANCKIASRR